MARRRAKENPVLSRGVEVGLGILALGAVVGGAYYLSTKSSSSSSNATASGDQNPGITPAAANVAAGNSATGGTAGS